MWFFLSLFLNLLHKSEEVIFFLSLFLFCVLASHMACGILVRQPGIEPEPPELEMQGLNH